jgi:hypothetical protein
MGSRNKRAGLYRGNFGRVKGQGAAQGQMEEWRKEWSRVEEWRNDAEKSSEGNGGSE